MSVKRWQQVVQPLYHIIMQFDHDGYLVYRHTNKQNGKCYIGITSQTPELRWRNGLGYRDQAKFYGAILKYGWDGFSHEILFDHLSQNEAYKLEKELIVKFDSIDNGYNIQSGGLDVGAWAKENLGIQIFQLDPCDYHIIRVFDSLSSASRIFNISATSILNAIKDRGTSAGYYWSKTSEYSASWKPRQNLKEERIHKIDKNTFEIIKTYDSIIDAAKENNISTSGLYRCHEFFSLGGFCWCKASEWFEGWKPSCKPNTATPIYQIEQKTLRIVNEWPSMIEASKVLRINKNAISRCCCGGGIVAYGYHWCKIADWSSNWRPKNTKPKVVPRRAVYQIDKNTLKILKKYESATEAAKMVGVRQSCIAKAAAGHGIESAGFFWCYVDSYFDWKPKAKMKTGSTGKKVYQYTLNGKLLKTWKCVKEAAENYNISPSNISNVCAGRARSAAGFKWSYKKHLIENTSLV